MANSLENKISILEKRLAAFQELHQALGKIYTKPSATQRATEICHYFKHITQAKVVTLFLLDPHSTYFHYSATTESNEKYVGGYLYISDEDLKKSIAAKLTERYTGQITIETQIESYDFSDKSLSLIPLKSFEGVNGLLLGEYDSSQQIRQDDCQMELIRLFLNHITPLIDHILDHERLEKKMKTIRLLYEIGHELGSVRQEDLLLERIMTLIKEHLHVDRCSLMIIEPDRKTMKIKRAFGMSGTDIDSIRVTIGQGIAGSVAESGKPLLIKDIEKETQFESPSPRSYFRTNSLLSIPLIEQGEVIGVINVNNRKDSQPFSKDDLHLLSAIGSEIATVLNNSYMKLQLKKAKELDRDIDASITF